MKFFEWAFGVVTLMLAGVIFLGMFGPEREDISEPRKSIVEMLDNTSFIEKDKDTGEYKIIKEKLTEDTLSLENNESLPRSYRLSVSLAKDPSIGFSNLDMLDQYNLDEQIHIVGNYYLYSDIEKIGDYYIDVLEENINNKQGIFDLKDSVSYQNNKDAYIKLNIPGYILVGMACIGFLLMFVNIVKGMI